jgi:hypothetical protein
MLDVTPKRAALNLAKSLTPVLLNLVITLMTAVLISH